MSMNRRLALLATTGLTLAACAGSTQTPTASVEQVIARIQAALPFTNLLAAAVVIAYPAAASYMPLVDQAIAQASAIFDTITSTMTRAQAQPLVAQISTDLGGGLTGIGQMIDLMPPSAAKTRYQALLAEARAILPLLTAFATGVTSVGATAPLVHMRIRTVR